MGPRRGLTRLPGHPRRLCVFLLTQLQSHLVAIISNQHPSNIYSKSFNMHSLLSRFISTCLMFGFRVTEADRSAHSVMPHLSPRSGHGGSELRQTISVFEKQTDRDSDSDRHDRSTIDTPSFFLQPENQRTVRAPVLCFANMLNHEVVQVRTTQVKPQ